MIRAELALDAETDAILARDPLFVTVCDARRDAWIASMEADAALDAEIARADLAPPLPWHLSWCSADVRMVRCARCGRDVPWFAVDTDGRCDRCPAAGRVAR